MTPSQAISLQANKLIKFISKNHSEELNLILASIQLENDRVAKMENFIDRISPSFDPAELYYIKEVMKGKEK